MNTNKHSALLLVAQTGDTTAIGKLLEICQADAKRYAYRHCAANNVDDAVQEALLIVSRKIKGLKTIASFSSWLFTIVKRECLRLERMMFGYEALDEGKLAQRIETTPVETLRIDLSAALGSLPPHYLKILLLRDFEELTISEIATRVGDTPSAVRNRLHRARALVREYLTA